MSTKVYDAFWFNGSLKELMEWLFEYRKRHVQMVLRRMRKIFRADADFSEVADLIRRTTKAGYNSELNIDDSVMVFAYGDQIYLKFFVAGELDKRVRLDWRLQDVHYQNSGDRPEDVSEKCWEERRQLWERLISHGPTFGENGLSFRLLPPYFEYVVAKHVCAGKTRKNTKRKGRR